jgi:hypothetical protein
LVNLSHFFFEKSLAWIMFFKLKLFKNRQVKHWVQFRFVSQLVNQQKTNNYNLIMRACTFLLKLFYNVVASYIWSLSVSITLEWKVIVNVVLHHARFQNIFPITLTCYHHKLSCANKIWVTSHFVVVIGESDVFIELHVQQTMTYKLIEKRP